MRSFETNKSVCSILFISCYCLLFPVTSSACVWGTTRLQTASNCYYINNEQQMIQFRTECYPGPHVGRAHCAPLSVHTESHSEGILSRAFWCHRLMASQCTNVTTNCQCQLALLIQKLLFLCLLVDDQWVIDDCYTTNKYVINWMHSNGTQFTCLLYLLC